MAVYKLWGNLRGEARRAVETLELDRLAGEGGLAVLMDALKRRFPDSQLRRLPRIYRGLFKDVRYRHGEDMATMLSRLLKAQHELENADDVTM
eukprot:7527922-Lingulodinium_polyedra.AAC.1